MVETPHDARFRRVPRPRRAAKRRPSAPSEAQAQPALDSSLQPIGGAPGDGDAEAGIHALLHQGMQLAEHDDVEEALDVLARAQTLAQTYQLPVWEAQALYNQGFVRAQAGQARAALPLLKRALARFGVLEDPRMYADVAIALGQVLLETDQPQHATLILQRALKQTAATSGANSSAPEEREALRFALLRGLGLAYQTNGQLDRALATYQQALEGDVQVIGLLEHATLFAPLLQLYADLGQVETALTTGYAWLEHLSPTDPEALHLFVELSFELGLLCSEWERHPEAVRAYKATYAARHRLRALVAESEEPMEVPSAFIGKVLANIGTAYLRQEAFREAVAYLRCGQEILDQTQDDEAHIPQQNLALLRHIFQERGRYEQLWRASEPLYRRLKAGPATLPN